jgi:hypothetical protein
MHFDKTKIVFYELYLIAFYRGDEVRAIIHPTFSACRVSQEAEDAVRRSPKIVSDKSVYHMLDLVTMDLRDTLKVYKYKRIEAIGDIFSNFQWKVIRQWFCDIILFFGSAGIKAYK